MSTTSAARRPRGAPGRTPGLRIGRSVVPVGMVIAILAAAIGGIALAATVRDALAAEIPSAITSVSVREDSVGVWDAVTVDIEWSVPDSASSGDTFRFTLPDALDPSVSGFELRAPDGQVVANAAISGTSVTFTLTDYVDTYSSVSGTAFFQNSIDRSVVTDDGDVPVTFQVHGGVTFTDVVEVTGTGYQIDRTVARKYGYFVDGQDQGRTDPVEAIAWSVESAMGPAATVEITDAPGAGHEIACSTVDVQIADAFEANGDIAAQHAADPGAYTLTCTAGAIGLTYTGLGDGEVVRLRYRTTITDQSVGNYTNGATIVMDDESWSRASNARRSNAGGDGGGSLTPSIAIEKYGTDAGPVDGDADEAPGQSVDAPTEVTMTITNDGDEALVDVAVADATDAGPALGGLSCDFSALGGPATGTTWAGPLAPAASFSCTGTLPALTGGQAHADTATVTATGQTSTTPVSDDDPWHAANPEVFDLALRKVLADGQSPTVSPLDLVDFAIEVFNQGNVTATDIAVTDHLPPGTVLADDDWTDGGDGTATTVLAGPLAPDTSTTVDVTLRLTPDAVAGQLDNLAEISSALDGDGEPATDVDSTPDGDPGNDPLVDDVIDSTPDGDPSDEDDHDIASVTLDAPRFDLALRKVLAEGQASMVERGDTVDFTIEVFNQGNVSASDIELTDTLPPDTTLADDDWAEGGDGTATIVLAGPLAPGESTTVDITVRLAEGVAAGTRTNLAEISDAVPAIDGLDDVDSTPDGDPGNDAMVDDVIDSTPDGDPSDEDDHDPASFEVPAFDLALRKTLAAGQPATVAPRAIVDFTIEVFNQGDVTATGVTVTDTLPPGTYLADGRWTDHGDGTASIVIERPIAPGESATVDIAIGLGPDAAAGDLDNLAEISSAADEDGHPVPDVDSTPDADPDDDPLVDDVIDSTPDGDPSDEDDHDIATVTMDTPVFDLALRKTTEADLVRVGDVVDFTIEVFNQGNLAATDIVVADTIPAELALASEGNERWQLVEGVALTTIEGPLAPGASTTVTIALEVVANAERIDNLAEIAVAGDPEGQPIADVDSVPDGDPGNDPLVDDVIDSTPTGDPADEDDHDVAPVRAPAFDLALRKVLGDDQAAIAWPGDHVAFAIEVHNQGQQTATDIVVTDELPAGLRFVADAEENLAAGWTLADGQLTTTLAGPLAPGEVATVPLVAAIAAEVGPGALVNTAEITTATDETGQPGIDVDSTPDADLDDDLLVDDVIDSTPTGDPADEDDHDVAEVSVPLVDLALRKQLADGQDREVSPGSLVDFTVTVFNQGDIAVTDVGVADTLPEGLAFPAGDANAGWTEVDGVVSTTIAGPLEPGAEVALALRLQVTADHGERLVNHAEITGQSDPEGTPRPDVDSVPDGDPTNDELTDDVIDQTPETGDEDDHDIAEVVTSSRVIDRIAEPTPAPAPGGPSPAGPPPARSSSPSTGVLPRTGTDLVGLVGLGLALVAVGTVAVRRRRPGVEVGA